PGALELLDQISECLCLARRTGRAAFECVEREGTGNGLHRRFRRGARSGRRGYGRAAGDQQAGSGGAEQSQHRGIGLSFAGTESVAKAPHPRNRCEAANGPLALLRRSMQSGSMHGDWKEAIGRARAYSPFLALALDRQRELASLLERGEGEAALAAAGQAGEGESVPIALRRRRLALAPVLAGGDPAGALPLARVIGQLSAFADVALA